MRSSTIIKNWIKKHGLEKYFSVKYDMLYFRYSPCIITRIAEHRNNMTEYKMWHIYYRVGSDKPFIKIEDDKAVSSLVHYAMKAFTLRFSWPSYHLYKDTFRFKVLMAYLESLNEK